MTEANRGSIQRSGWVAIAAGVLGGVLLLGTVTVSYTHLDVYKRQLRSLRRE